MKTDFAPTTSKARARGASAILVILVFLGLMAVVVVSNNLALRHLDRNLRLIEEKQLKKAAVPVKHNIRKQEPTR